MRASFQAQRHQLGELNAQVEDSLSGVRVVKSFANEEIEKEKFAQGNLRFLDIKKTMYHAMAGFHSCLLYTSGSLPRRCPGRRALPCA